MPRHDPLLKRSDHRLHGLKLRREHDKARARIDQASAYRSTMFSSTTAQPPIAVADAAPPLRVKACPVSRVTPVQTAVRNYTGDEGGPFGFGDQVADPKPPQAAAAKIRGGERCGKVGTMIPAGMVERGERKRTASEALRRCQNRRLALPPGSARGMS